MRGLASLQGLRGFGFRALGCRGDPNSSTVGLGEFWWNRAFGLAGFWGLGFRVRDVPGGAPAPALILRPLPPDHPSPGPTQSSVKHSATIEAQGFDSLRLRGLLAFGGGSRLESRALGSANL